MTLNAVILSLFFMVLIFPASVEASEQKSPEYHQLSRYSWLALDTYGPVTDGETLWDITQHRYPQSHLPINAMMIGLFRLNPGAFERGNINCLKTGGLLLLPDIVNFPAISNAEADQQVSDHHQQWETLQRRCHP